MDPAKPASASATPDDKFISTGPFPLSSYIPLGSVEVERYAEQPPLQTSSFNLDSQWDLVTDSTDFDPSDESRSIVQAISQLSAAHWILAFKPHASSRVERWRIYLLPHDVGRGQIDRRHKLLQSRMRVILASLSTSIEAWNNKASEAGDKFDLWASPENLSLFYMFNTLPSPKPQPELVRISYMATCLNRILDRNEDPWGLQTALYPYQRRAVATMLQRELEPSRQLDPRFEERTSMTGETYYYNARDELFLKSPRYYDTVKGGILAETMGLGKTLICLATVLATRGQYPDIPVPYIQEHKWEHVPSLANLAASAATRAGTPWKTYFEELQELTGEQHDECMRVMASQRPTYDMPPKVVRTMRKSSVYGAVETVKLCSGTIIVVPANLVQQWESELAKHTRPNTLKLIVLKDRKAMIPSSDELLEYDIVLFSKARFEREVSTTDDLYVSPLKGVHWLRMIIDEGQGFTSGPTNAANVAEKVVTAERRWIVSGTPAKDLIGVEVSVDAMQISNEEDKSQTYREEALERRRLYDKEIEMRSGAARNLGLLTTKFLKAQPWAMPVDGSDSAASWDEYIYRHEDFRSRTYTSYSKTLRSTLNSIVVKTRPEDVEKDLLLPPLKHQVARLAPSAVDKMTANLFVLLYTTNAITSERRDQDYLFHSSSRSHLNSLTRNLRQSTFFWVGFGADSIQASLDIGDKYLAKEEINCSAADRQLLVNTMEAARTVLRSPVWRALSTTQEMGVFLNKWPEESKTAWLFDQCLDPPATGLTQLGQAQRYVNRQLASDDPFEGLRDAAQAAGESDSASDVAMSSGSGESRSLEMVKTGLPSAVMGDNFRPKKARRPSKGRSKSASVSDGPPKPERSPAKKPVTAAKRKVAMDSKSIDLAADSPLGSIQALGTASAKLTYLVDRVMALQGEEKILIFYDGGHIAYYISQMLDLLNVKHLIYANTLSSELRSKYIVLFDTDASYRVLVMDIKQAARGLNVSSASRVFFVTPPYQPDVEAQAIKRAHRIGQTRPVYVETLVLAGTIEEAMHDRAGKMTQTEHSSTKNIEDDEDIRNIIQNAKVIPLSAEEEATLQSQKAAFSVPQQIFGRPGRVARSVEGLEMEIFGDDDDDFSPRAKRRTKKKTVHFREESPTPSRPAVDRQPEAAHTVVHDETSSPIRSGPASVPSIFG